MKIQIISDLHQEFGSTELCFDNADIVVLAGDINLGTKGIDWIKNAIPDKPVLYVLGNHEYYKGSYPKTLHKIKETARGPMSLYLKIHLQILMESAFTELLYGQTFPSLETLSNMECSVRLK